MTLQDKLVKAAMIAFVVLILGAVAISLYAKLVLHING